MNTLECTKANAAAATGLKPDAATCDRMAEVCEAVLMNDPSADSGAAGVFTFRKMAALIRAKVP